MKKITSFILIIVFIFGASAPVFAASASSGNVPFENLFYYVPGFVTYNSFFTNASKVGIFAPQNFTFDANGNLTGSISALTQAVITTNKTRVMPLVANDNFDQTIVDTFLKSTSAQTTLINSLVASAKTNNYIGWQLDVEHISATDRALYSTFVANTATAFHKNNLELSVAVVSRTSDNPSDLPAGSWNNWSGVYDYAALAKSADFISVMDYDQAPSSGPVASLSWFKQVIAYALKYIPKSKLSLGIADYGWQWNTDVNERISTVGYPKISDLISSRAYTTKGYDATLGEAWITFTKTSNGLTTHYKIWYENAQSFQTKIAIAKSDGLRGISVWVIGMEDPGIWKLVK